MPTNLDSNLVAFLTPKKEEALFEGHKPKLETPAIPQEPYLETDRSTPTSKRLPKLLKGINDIEASGNPDYWGYTTSGTKYDTAFGPLQMTSTLVKDFRTRNPKKIFNEEELAWMGRAEVLFKKASGIEDKNWRKNPDIGWTEEDKKKYQIVAEKIFDYNIGRYGEEGAVKRWRGHKDKNVNQKYWEHVSKVADSIPDEQHVVEKPRSFKQLPPVPRKNVSISGKLKEWFQEQFLKEDSE